MSCPQFHFAVVGYYIATLVYVSGMDLSNVTDEKVKNLRDFGPFYLTLWNWGLHLLYFFMHCINHTLQKMPMKISTSLRRMMGQMTNYLFCALVFPLTIYVSSTFWIMFAYDRELLYPRALDAASPPWFNHVMHTSILPVALLELALHRHRFPPPRTACLSLAALLAAYGLAMTYVYFRYNVALYPLYPMLNWTQRGLFFAVSVAECSVFYLLGEKLNTLCWGNRIKSVHGEKQQ
ncbi:androgen-dependent TFPI-regulating protein-like [Bacillus rossius redtenbacheri]|uniref:androgen-dependent TFPI-regulating protein-like n=1 Tax=Bacillus rossius redtenbacheri TaxID=93214 RepID=UPI002FDE7934